jgi:hypothetical protein
VTETASHREEDDGGGVGQADGGGHCRRGR